MTRDAVLSPPRARGRATRMRVATAAVAVLALACAALVSGSEVASSTEAGEVDQARVVKVVDGDTLDVTGVRGTQRVRLLNVDAPETVDPNRPVGCLGPQASAFLTELLPPGTAVTLEYDGDREDRYGRTLAAVSVGSSMVNVRLAEEGLAVPVTVGGNTRFRPAVDRAWQRAVTEKKGLLDPRQECTAGAQVAALSESVASLSDSAQWSEPSQVADTSAGADHVLTQAQALFALLVAGEAVEVAGLPGRQRAAYARAIYGTYVVARVLQGASTARGQQLHDAAVATKKAAADEKKKAAAEAKRAAAKKKAAVEAKRAAARKKAAVEAKKAAARKKAAAKKADADRRSAVEHSKTPVVKKKEATKKKPPSSGGGPAGYTGCRRYAPGGGSWTPMECP